MKKQNLVKGQMYSFGSYYIELHQPVAVSFHEGGRGSKAVKAAGWKCKLNAAGQQVGWLQLVEAAFSKLDCILHVAATYNAAGKEIASFCTTASSKEVVATMHAANRMHAMTGNKDAVIAVVIYDNNKLQVQQEE